MSWLTKLLLGATTTVVVLTTMCFIRIDAQCLSLDDDLTTIPTYHDISGMINFDLNLFRDLYAHSKQDQNVFISPYSIWTALILVYLGSGGKTRTELENALGIDDKVAILKTWRVLEHMYNGRKVKNSHDTFVTVNRAFFAPQISVNPCITSILYDELETLDFSQPYNAAARINRFVRNRTFGKISQLVQPDDLYDAVAVMANAAAFKGTWHVKFNRKDTVQERFYSSPEDYRVVPMMNLQGEFNYGKSYELGAQVLELPYADGFTSMYLVLPAFSRDPDLGLADLISRLTPDNLRSGFANVKHQKVNIKMPRFKLTNGMKSGLEESLTRMGIKDLFGNKANLTILAPSGGLKVSKAIHVANVDVNEEGTEASAATIFIIETRTRTHPPVFFKCNRPFLFIIQDNFTKNILFIGTYRNVQN